MESVDELIARTAQAHGCSEETAARIALEERLRVNVGLLMENAELKRRLQS
jgi:hypothetical protein